MQDANRTEELPMICTICNRPAEDGYVNEAAGEKCIDPCHTFGDCAACGYAAVGGKCGNPVCSTVNPAAAKRWADEGARRRAEQNERERLSAIRSQCFKSYSATMTPSCAAPGMCPQTGCLLCVAE